MQPRLAVIDRFEEDQAVLIFDNHEELSWPRADLPKNCNVGTTVSVVIAMQAAETAKNKRKAQLLLDDIIP